MGCDQIIFNLTEDRDDSFYDDFVKGYSENIIKAIEAGESDYESFFYWDQDEEHPNDVIKVNVFIQRDHDFIFPFDVVGGADFEEIELTITINDVIYDDYSDDIKWEIQDSLRHEIEHVSQYRDDTKPEPKHNDSVTYFQDAIQPHEIPAYVQGFRTRAKGMDKSFEEVVDNYLDVHSDKFNDSEKATLKRAWISYVKKHYKGEERRPLNESVEDSGDDLKRFIIMCKNELGIQNLPKIKLTNNREDLVTTAHYRPSKEVKIYIKGRALVDVLRSIAHELVHHKQYENDELSGDIPDIGGPIEDEANAFAGRYIKMYAKKGNPHIYLT